MTEKQRVSDQLEAGGGGLDGAPEAAAWGVRGGFESGLAGLPGANSPGSGCRALAPTSVKAFPRTETF